MMRFQRSRACTVRETLPPKTRSQGPSALTASMKGSVTSTLTLKLRRRAGSDFAVMKASISG